MADSIRTSPKLLLILAMLLPVPTHTLAQGFPETSQFKEVCSAEYTKSRSNATETESSRWCDCMATALGVDAQIDFVNFMWLSTLDPTKQADQAKAARILNIAPYEIQKASTAAAESALKSILARVKGSSEGATIICRAQLGYKSG